MNSKQQDMDKKKKRDKHSVGFSSAHAKGGLVAWPDGSTSRIGEYRMKHAFAKGDFEERTGFIGRPGTAAQALRA